MRQPKVGCPFCGDNPQVHEMPLHGNESKLWLCGCFAYECYVKPISGGQTRDEAIDNWERRSTCSETK